MELMLTARLLEGRLLNESEDWEVSFSLFFFFFFFFLDLSFDDDLALSRSE